MAKRGRPTSYRPGYCAQLLEHMEKGLSFESFAGRVRVCKQTIYSWLEAQPEFLDAKKRGLELSRLFWECLGIEGTKGAHKNFNAAMWIFNMKNRFDWRDRHDVNAQVVSLEDLVGGSWLDKKEKPNEREIITFKESGK